MPQAVARRNSDRPGGPKAIEPRPGRLGAQKGALAAHVLAQPCLKIRTFVRLNVEPIEPHHPVGGALVNPV